MSRAVIFNVQMHAKRSARRSTDPCVLTKVARMHYSALSLSQNRALLNSFLQRLSRELDGPVAGSMATDEARSVHEHAARQAGRV